MPTIFESLLFEIGIDTKKLKTESKEAEAHLQGVEERSGKAIEAIEQRGKQSEALFKGIKEEAGGFLSIVAGAFTTAKIAEFAKNNMLGAESLGYMAGNLGMATERLRAWQLAAEKNGGTAAGMTAMLQQAGTVVAESKRGLKFNGSTEFFGQGGVPQDLESVESYLNALSRILKRNYAQSPVQGANVAQRLGVTPEALNLLKQGPGAIQAILKEQEKYAAVSQSWSDEAHKTLNSYRDTENSLTKIGTIMLGAVNPELRKMAEFAERAAAAMTDTAEGKAQVKQDTPHLMHQLGWQFGARYSGRWLPGVFGKAGKIAAGPFGSAVSFLADPDSTVSQAQEDAAMEQWRREHGGGGDDKEAYLWQQERNHGLPPGSMSQIWEQESGKGKNKGPSSAGAMGDFQLMPKTWEGYKRPEDDNINDFYQNSAAAARLLDELYNKQFKGDWNATLRWYNAGRNYNGQQAHQYANEVMARPLGKPEVVRSQEPEKKSNQLEPLAPREPLVLMPPEIPAPQVNIQNEGEQKDAPPAAATNPIGKVDVQVEWPSAERRTEADNDRKPFVFIPSEPPKPLVNMPGNEGLRREYPPIGKVDVQVEWPDSRVLLGGEDRKPFVWVPPVETGDGEPGDSPLQNLGWMPFDDRSNDQPDLKVEIPENNYLSEIRNGMQPAASTTTNNSTQVNVHGPVTIQTQSTDPQGIKQEFTDQITTTQMRTAQQMEMGTF